MLNLSSMKDDHHEICNTRLELGIGLDDFLPKIKEQQKSKNKGFTCLDLSFPLHFKDEQNIDGSSAKENGEEGRQSNSGTRKQEEYINNGIIRKKLRLTKEQCCILEDSFKQQTTLNTAQKHALAEKLSLKRRQIEVWFQNRRARTKMKQTEVDCVFLKTSCENLREENRRLKKELEELRSSILQRATICHSCEKFAKSSAAEESGGAQLKLACSNS